MNFTFNIKPTFEITKPYNPSSIDIKINGVDDNGNVQLQTKTTEILQAEENGNGSGVRTEERTFFFPSEMIQSIFTGVDLSTGLPKVNIQAVNQLLSQYNLEVVEA